MEVKLVVDYEAYENGQTMAKSIEELAAKPESAQITDLIIGDWGGAYESSPEDFIPVLVKLKDQFPKIRKLFIGDMEYDECEVSWINQTNLSPLLEAFPALESFHIKGSQDLSLEPLRHSHLQELVIICGGLPVRFFSKYVMPNCLNYASWNCIWVSRTMVLTVTSMIFCRSWTAILFPNLHTWDSKIVKYRMKLQLQQLMPL